MQSYDTAMEELKARMGAVSCDQPGNKIIEKRRLGSLPGMSSRGMLGSPTVW